MQAAVSSDFAAHLSESRGQLVGSTTIKGVGEVVLQKRAGDTINEDGTLNTQKVNDIYDSYVVVPEAEWEIGKIRKWGRRVEAIDADDDVRALQEVAAYENKDRRIAEEENGQHGTKSRQIEAWSRFAATKPAPKERRPPTKRHRRGPDAPRHPPGPLPLPGMVILHPGPGHR
jgi:hypothetical protein